MRTIFALLLMLLAAGCGKKDAASNAATPSAESTFQGTIRAKQWIYTALRSSEVTYTISQERIRREIKSTFVLDKLVAKISGTVIAGVICNPRKDEVIIYCSNGAKKRYCRLSLKEYAELTNMQSPDGFNYYHGFGHLYLDIPPENFCQITNTPDNSTLEGRRCDLHNLHSDNSVNTVTIATDHTHTVNVPRELLRLAEPNIPDSVTGFPMRIRRVETLSILNRAQAQAKPTDERYKRWLAKAAELASRGIKKVFECGTDILSIDTSAPGHSAFELASDFTDLKSLGAYHEEFRYLDEERLKGGGGGDWDD